MKKIKFFLSLFISNIFILPTYADQTEQKMKFYQIYNVTEIEFIYKNGDSEECLKLNTISPMNKTEVAFLFKENKSINCIFNSKDNPICEVLIQFFPGSLLKPVPSETCKQFDFQAHGRTQRIEVLKIKMPNKNIQ